MAKSARSKVKKKLRTISREKVEQQAKWLQEAEAKRLAAAQKCLESAPVQCISQVPDDDIMEVERAGRRGRTGGKGGGGASAMAIDGGNGPKGKLKGGVAKLKGRPYKGPKILVASVHGAKRKNPNKKQRSKSHGRNKH